MSLNPNRQIVLDTETTGMNKLGAPHKGHRIIEIGAVEVINRRLTGRHYHVYLQPGRLVDLEAYSIHGISDEFLADKQTFSQIADELLCFIRGSELVIHNAAFDIGFMDQEFSLLDQGITKTETFCTITDSLLIARSLFPGKRNNLDALCNRYKIDNSKRTVHGALLDAEILAEVYLAMTGGQESMTFHLANDCQHNSFIQETPCILRPAMGMKVIYASSEDLVAHEEHLDLVLHRGGSCLWRH